MGALGGFDGVGMARHYNGFMTDAERRALYADVEARIASLLDGEDDWIAAMATVASELHGSFDYFATKTTRRSSSARTRAATAACASTSPAAFAERPHERDGRSSSPT